MKGTVSKAEWCDLEVTTNEMWLSQEREMMSDGHRRRRRKSAMSCRSREEEKRLSRAVSKRMLKIEQFAWIH